MNLVNGVQGVNRVQGVNEVQGVNGVKEVQMVGGLWIVCFILVGAILD